MIKKYYDQDCPFEMLENKTIAIIGYGSQGHAHALNLRESGAQVLVGLRENSQSGKEAQAAGLEVVSFAQAAERADLVMMLLPDEVAPKVYEKDIRPYLVAGNVLMFAHGFNIHYGLIEAPAGVDVIMVAPKGPGHTVRRQYQAGFGVPALIAVEQDASGQAKEYALAYAKGIGAGRAGILETSFREETETDLFGEQAVLCGGVTELMQAGFETLVEAGYAPEMAYFECIHEMKLIIDMIYEGGFKAMRDSVSNTAEYGDYAVGKRMINENTRAEMRKVLAEIQDGSFASEFVQEFGAGQRVKYQATKKLKEEHQLEEVGQELRQMMSWIKK